MESSQQDMDVIFFLGAGASVNAGVPDTFGFVSKFKESLAENSEQLKAYEKILEILKSWRKGQGPFAPEVDVELLLETLERLENREQDILLKFHQVSSYALDGFALKKPLKDQLKDLIRRTGIVNANKVSYFEPLLSFVGENKPLDIFSVNYDMSIEQFCNVYKREYVDGFDLYWNPKSFERTEVDIRLYKIHGSILWYKTDRGYYVKLPTKIEGSRTELITGEQAVSLMLYPMRKWDYDEPLLEMLIKMKERLEKANFVVIVGYSFRDDHIRRIFWDAGRANKELTVVLISPNSPEIYENKLKDYQIPELSHGFSSEFERDATGGFDAYLPSSLAGRVVYLPYKFEDFLPTLNSYLTDLKSAIALEKQTKEREYKGEMPNLINSAWGYTLRVYLFCEYVDKIKEIYPKVDWSKEQFGDSFETHFNIVLTYMAVGKEYDSKPWSEKLDSYLNSLSPNNLVIEVIGNVYRLSFKMNENSIPFQSITPSLLNIIKIAKRKSKVQNEDIARHVQRIATRLEMLYEYMMLVQNGFSLPDYLKITRNVWELPPDAGIEKAKDRILWLEKKNLENIFGGSKLNMA
jgi:hypothetical protein